MALGPLPFEMLGLGAPTRQKRVGGSPMPGSMLGIPELPELPDFSFGAPSPTPQPQSFMPEMAPPPAPTQPDYTDPNVPLPEEESRGLLWNVADILSRPGYALRGVLTGRPEALAGLIPFSETMGLFGDEQRVSGQKLLQEWGLQDEGAEAPLLSGAGLAGLGVEFIDPLMLVGGLGALNKAGKASQLVQGTLKTTRGLAAASRAARVAGDLRLAEELAAQARPIVEGLAFGTSKAGQAMKFLKANNLPLELAGSAGSEAAAGQRALLTLGGETHTLPFIPPINLPEMTIAKGAPIIEAAANTGQWLKEAPFIKPVADLFSKTPKGVDAETGKIIADTLDQARITEGAMSARAAEEASAFDTALRDPSLVSDVQVAAEREAAVEAATKKLVNTNEGLVDPTTGEMFVPASAAEKAAAEAAQTKQVLNETSDWTKQLRDENDALKAELKATREPVPAPDVGGVVHTPPPSPTLNLPGSTIEESMRAAETLGISKAEPVAQLPEIATAPAIEAMDKVATGRQALELAEEKVGVSPFKKVRPNLEYTRDAFQQDVRTAFKLKPDQADAVLAITDARAETWAREAGKDAEEWYKIHLASVSRGRAPVPLRDVEQLAAQQSAIRKGSTKFLEDGRAVLKGFQKADVSTAVHEIGHVFRRDLPPVELATVEKWAGVEGGKWTVATEEKFANAFEQYLKTGNAPTTKLQGVFEKFKEWLSNIYRRIVGNRPEAVNPELRGVFDRLLGKADEVGAVERSAIKTGPRELFQAAEGQGRYTSIAAMAKATKGKGGAFVDYAGVSTEEAARIKAATKFDVAGYSHVIDDDAIRHILNGHANDALPVTLDDFDRLPEIFKNPDEIIKTVTEQGKDAIRYKKRINGHVIVVEEVRYNREKLGLTSMYKRRARVAEVSRSVHHTPEASVPPRHVVNATGSPPPMGSLPREMESVKPEGFPPIRPGRTTLPEEELFQTEPRTSGVQGGAQAVEEIPVQRPAVDRQKSYMPPDDLSKQEITRRMRIAENNAKTIAEQMRKAPIELQAGEEFQRMAASGRMASKEAAFYEDWLTSGRRPAIGPHATSEEVNIALTRQQAKTQLEQHVRGETAIKSYLGRAGLGTRQAAEKAAAMFPEASPEVQRQLTTAIELGKDMPGKAGEVVKAYQARNQQMLDLEQGMSIPTPALRDPRVGYATHAVTATGKKFFRGLRANKRAELFVELQRARKAAGLPETEMAGALSKQLRTGGGGEVRMVPERARFGAAQIERLDEKTKAFIKANKLEAEYLAYEKTASVAHPSQIERLQVFKGLTIPELNDAFRKVGARDLVFSENPAVQAFVRESRHARAMAADKVFRDLGSKLGSEIPEHLDNAMPTGAGLEEFKNATGQPQYGIAEFNAVRRQRGMPPIVFPDRSTAEAVQKSMNKLLNPEEAEGLLAWWDDTTKMLKGWVTKGFPSYHVRNRMGNRMQSWLEDVPVAGDHYRQATRFLAGMDGKVRLADGRVLDRDAIIKLSQDEGILSGGFFESEFKDALKQQASKNPLASNNVFVNKLENISAGATAAPGRLISGAGLGDLKNVKAQDVEAVDRLGHFIYKLQHNSVTDSVASVKKALFDYSDLNDFEKNTLGRLVFFYAYTRKVLPYMLDRLIQRPGKIAAMGRIGSGGALPAILPEYTREGLPVGMGEDASGKPLIAYGFGTPLEAAAEPFVGFMQGPQRGLEKSLSQLNPLVRVPLEVATGRRFFLGQGIEESRKAPHWVDSLPPELQKAVGAREVTLSKGGKRFEMDPYDLYLIENSPFGRLSTTIGKAVDSDKPVAVRVLNTLTGIKIVSVDTQKEAYLAAKNARMTRLKELERRGMVREVPEIYALTEAGKAEAKENPSLKKLVRGK